jgi:acetyl esterase/lipase
VPPGNVIVAGDSAGGGLCVALMMYLRDEGYPLPGAAILMCPWVGEIVVLQAAGVSSADLLLFMRNLMQI